MPYIDKETRENEVENSFSCIEDKISFLIEHIKTFDIDEREGVCNYCISRIVAGSMKSKTGWRYKFLNRAIGIFECAKQEFIRRVVNPYEDKKIEESGDLPEYE